MNTIERETNGAPPRALSADEKRARLNTARQKQEAAIAERRLNAEYERLELAERFERELGGPEGEQFAIHDATELGEGFFVVKLPPSIVWKTYWESKMTDVDQCNLVAQCVVHPSKEQYLTARGRRMGIDQMLTNLVGRLNGLKFKEDEKK